MISGWLSIAATGLFWTLTGVAVSRVSRGSSNWATGVLSIFLPSSLFTFVVCLLFVSDPRPLLAGNVPRAWEMAACMMGAGVCWAVGMVSLNRAMSSGHQGSAWTIAQSALLFPFLAGVMAYSDPLPLNRVIGVGLILLAIIAFGRVRSQGTAAQTPAPAPAAWLGFAILTMFCFGTQQTLLTLPSHWPDWSDTGQMRVPIGSIGKLAGLGIFAMVWRVRLDRRLVLWGLLLSMAGVVSQFLLFHGLDVLGRNGQASLGIPVAVGICVIGFVCYSILVMREHTTRIHWLGLVAGAGGIVAVAL